MQPIDTATDAAWKQRFRIHQTYGQLATGDQTRGLALSNRSGVFQLYAWDVVSGDLRQLTARPAGERNGMIAGDGRFVYYLNDTQGDELGHYVRVPFTGGASEDITPDMAPYSSFTITSSRDGRRIGFVSADDRGFHVHIANGSNERRLLYESAQLIDGLCLAADGAYAVVATNEGMSGLNFRLLAFDTTSGVQIGALSDGAEQSVQVRLCAPTAGDQRVLAVSNHSGANRPLIWNVRSGERTDLVLDELAGDVEPQDWSADGARVLLLQIAQATHQLYLYHLDDHTLTKLAHPAGTFAGAFFGPDDTIFANWQNSTNPQQLVALADTTGQLARVVLPASDAPPARPWRSVTFPSSGGQSIQAWLAVPEGAGPFPTILETHGGPTYAMTDLYHAGSQAWLDHGYAFMSINYRGSTTFGKAFEEAIWSNLGNLEIDDMAAARDWLVREGIADPEAILLTGWSYGGYLTLQALGRRPELWAGGMAGIAIADWAMQYADSADTLRGYQAALFGGTPDEQPELYAAASPISYAAHVAAPVLVIQGSNDTRCPPRPMRVYEARLRELGKDIEVVWFDAGHGSLDTEQSVGHQELMLRFAARVLG